VAAFPLDGTSRWGDDWVRGGGYFVAQNKGVTLKVELRSEDVSVRVVSPLSPDECATRLLAAIDTGWLLSRIGSQRVIGCISTSQSGISIRLRKRIGYHNSGQTYLMGCLEQHGQGTIFRGNAGMHPSVRVFLAVWFSLLLLICIIVAVQFMIAGGGPLGLVLIIPVMLAAAIVVSVLMGILRWLARDEEQFLVEFLAKVTGGQKIAVDASDICGDENRRAADVINSQYATSDKLRIGKKPIA
jgi:hypothetical protein